MSEPRPLIDRLDSSMSGATKLTVITECVFVQNQVAPWALKCVDCNTNPAEKAACTAKYSGAGERVLTPASSMSNDRKES